MFLLTFSDLLEFLDSGKGQFASGDVFQRVRRSEKLASYSCKKAQTRLQAIIPKITLIFFWIFPSFINHWAVAQDADHDGRRFLYFVCVPIWVSRTHIIGWNLAARQVKDGASSGVAASRKCVVDQSKFRAFWCDRNRFKKGCADDLNNWKIVNYFR